MATESELVDLLDTIGDRAPDPQDTLARLALQTSPSSARRWLPIGAAATVVAVAVAAALVVRGTDASTPAGDPVVGPTVDRATYALPLDAYYASAKQERTLQRAQFVLAQRCAQARGVRVPTARIPAGDPEPAFAGTVANDIRPLTLQQARTLGYDLYPAGTSAVDTVLATLTPQQVQLVRGWSSDLNLPKPTDPFLLRGGCLGQAEQTLLRGASPAPVRGLTTSTGRPGLFADDATVTNDYLNEARSGGTTPQVLRAQQRWSACMAHHGYPGLASTTDGIERLANLRSAAAKSQAVQDVQCKESTGFMTVWVASMIEAQRAVIDAHRSRLDGFKKRLATRMANAARALN